MCARNIAKIFKFYLIKILAQISSAYCGKIEDTLKRKKAKAIKR